VVVVRGGPAGEFDVPIVKDIVRTFAPERGEIVIDEAILDLGGSPVDEPVARPPRKRPRWSRHGKGAAGRPSGGETPASGTQGVDPPGGHPPPGSADPPAEEA